MKSSIFLVAAGAMLAMGGPIVDKRVMKTVIETDIVYVTVTAGDEPQSIFFAGAHRTKELPTTSSTPTSTSTSTSSTPPPPPPETPTPTPEPEPTPTPVVVKVPEPTTEQPAPAVETTKVSKPASSPVVDAEPASSPTDFASTAVYHHNLHRVNNSAPAVSWGESYASYAAQTANSCKFAHDLTPGGGGYGQNIAMWATSGDAESVGAEKAIAQAITNMWYNGELDLFPSGDYGLDNPDFSNFESFGHYTQVVWAGSKQVGCEAKYCPPGTMVQGMGAWFSVCNYYPAGNMGGQYGKNVLPPLGRATVQA